MKKKTVTVVTILAAVIIVGVVLIAVLEGAGKLRSGAASETNAHQSSTSDTDPGKDGAKLGEETESADSGTNAADRTAQNAESEGAGVGTANSGSTSSSGAGAAEGSGTASGNNSAGSTGRDENELPIDTTDPQEGIELPDDEYDLPEDDDEYELPIIP